MKFGYITFLFLIALGSFGQDEKVFKVSRTGHISLSPNLDTLVDKHDYVFHLEGFPLKDVYRIQFTGGTAKVKDSAIQVRTQTSSMPGRKYVLKIFARKSPCQEQ